MENSLSSKTKVILLKRGGRIWVSEKEASLASEAKLVGEGVVDIDGQLVEVAEIRAIVNGDTYQGTAEKRLDKQNETYGQPAPKNDCRLCGGDGFIIVKRDDPIYDAKSVPCPSCNPNPPTLKW